MKEIIKALTVSFTLILSTSILFLRRIRIGLVISIWILQVSYLPVSGVKKGAGKERGILSEAQHRAYLDRHPYKEYQQEELQYAK